MQFTFDRDYLIMAIQMGNVKGKDLYLNTHLKAYDNFLTVHISDGVLQYEQTILCDNCKEGEVVVNTKRLLDTLKALDVGEVYFVVEDNKVMIRSPNGSKHYNMASYTAERYPDFESDEGVEYSAIPCDTLCAMIKRAIASVGNDDTRLWSCGLRFMKEGETLTLVSTDGKKLSLDKGSLGLQGADYACTVPVPVLRLLYKDIAKSKGSVSIGYKSGRMYFKYNSIKFSSPCINIQYPAYDRVVDQVDAYNKLCLTAERAKFIEAMQALNPLISEARFMKHLRLNIEDADMEVTAKRDNGESANATVPITYEGAKISVCFDHPSLLGLLNACDSKDVILRFDEDNAAMGAVKIVPTEGDYFHILMPCNTKEEVEVR